MCLESVVAYSDKEWEAPMCLESVVAYSDKEWEAPMCLESVVAGASSAQAIDHAPPGPWAEVSAAAQAP
jgi:hypothetical protein